MSESYKNKENRPLEHVEFEFVSALESNDKEASIDLLRERQDLIVFFCAVATIRHQSETLNDIIPFLPEDLKYLSNTISRMTKKRKITQVAQELLEETSAEGVLI
jgi:hypothetical protein